MSLFITSGTITAKFSQNIIPLTLKCEISGYGGMDQYTTYSLSLDDIDLQICLLFSWYAIRDNGQVTKDETYSDCFNKNEIFLSNHFYDDGYGNYEDLHIEKINSIKILKGSKIIYSGSELPVDKGIYNGYQIFIENIIDR